MRINSYVNGVTSELLKVESYGLRYKDVRLRM